LSKPTKKSYVVVPAAWLSCGYRPSLTLTFFDLFSATLAQYVLQDISTQIVPIKTFFLDEPYVAVLRSSGSTEDLRAWR
jgi:hypothetical protein